MIFCNGQMDELIRKFIGLRFYEKAEQLRIRIYRRQVLVKEGILADQDTDNGHILVAVRSQSVSAVRLTDIALIFAYRDQIVIFFGQRLIAAFVGVIDEEKVLPMERLTDLSAFKYTDENIFVIIPRPIGCDISRLPVFHLVKRQVKRAELNPKLVDGKIQKLIFSHSAPPFSVDNSIAENVRICK